MTNHHSFFLKCQSKMVISLRYSLKYPLEQWKPCGIPISWWFFAEAGVKPAKKMIKGALFALSHCCTSKNCQHCDKNSGKEPTSVSIRLYPRECYWITFSLSSQDVLDRYYLSMRLAEITPNSENGFFFRVSQLFPAVALFYILAPRVGGMSNITGAV